MRRSLLGAIATLIVLALDVTAIVNDARAQGTGRDRFFPQIQDRIRRSDMVCFATILRTQANGSIVLEGEERTQWLATARVDRVVKGQLPTGDVHFKYYGIVFPKDVVHPYFGPPLADFQSGVRYVLFLSYHGGELEVAIPVYSMEIRVRPERPTTDQVDSDPNMILATEFVAMADTHYFSWAEELIGKRAVAVVKPFLTSSDPLVRYDAAWWLSFRQLDVGILHELTRAANDETVAEYARDGAQRRLADITAGYWLPH